MYADKDLKTRINLKEELTLNFEGGDQVTPSRQI